MSEQTESLGRITERLEQLAAELAAEKDEARAAELVSEASKLAAEAGEEADRVLRQASGAVEEPEQG